MNTLDWLFQHSGKVLTPQEWCGLLNVTIVDPDGWRGRGPVGRQNGGRDLETPLGLVEFINRLSESTIITPS